MRPFASRIAAASWIIACMACNAEVVNYAFGGTVIEDEARRGYGSFAGSFSFESTAGNQIDDPSHHLGSYAGAGLSWTFGISFDGGVVLDISSQGIHLNTMNNLAGQDWLGLLGKGNAGTVSVGLYDFTQGVLSDAGLPLKAGGYSLAEFGASEFRWESTAGMLQGVLTSFSCLSGCNAAGSGGGTPSPSPVPEPASAVLLSIGLPYLLYRRALSRKLPCLPQPPR